MVTFEQMTTEKFRFVALGILHTITPSRTRLPHLAHDFKVGWDGCFYCKWMKIVKNGMNEESARAGIRVREAEKAHGTRLFHREG